MSALEEKIEERIIEFQKNYKFELPQRVILAQEVVSAIEHTLLRPTATEEEIDRLCDEAVQYGFYGVCVNPVYVRRAVEKLKDTSAKVVSVVGFPLGANTQCCKAREAEELVELGVDELDMVLNISMMKSRDYKYVYEDIKSVVEASQGRCVKVIIETCYLTQEEKNRGVRDREARRSQVRQDFDGLWTKWCNDRGRAPHEMVCARAWGEGVWWDKEL